MIKQIILFVLLISLGTNTTYAQTLSKDIELKWKEQRKTTITENNTKLAFWHFVDAGYQPQLHNLPIFSYQIPLEQESRLDIRLVNSSFESIELNKEEMEQVSNDIDIQYHITYEKKRPIAVISFIPIQQNANGQYEKLLKASLQIQTTPINSAKPTSRGGRTTESNLASGQIFKIAIGATGIYKLDYNFLQSLGVDVDNINPKNIQILGDGGNALSETVGARPYTDVQEVAISVVGEQDGQFNSGDYILFYGVGAKNWNYYQPLDMMLHKSNIYTDTSHYFIKIANNNGLRIGNQASISNTAYTTTSFDNVNHYELDEVSLMEEQFALTPSGRAWYGEEFRVVKDRSFSFYLPNRIASIPLEIRMNAAVDAPYPNYIKMTVNGQEAINKQYNYTPVGSYPNIAANATIHDSVQVSGDQLNVTLSLLNSNSSANMWLDYITINSRCNLTFTGGQMAFRDIESLQHASATFQLSNTNNTTIWDVTNPNEVKIQKTTGSNTLSFGLKIDTLKEFIAFDGRQFHTPTAIGPIANQNLHGITSPKDLLIVYHADFKSAADRLAAHRSSHSGISIELVDVEQIYNEFSSGNPDISAVRDFSKLLYDRSTVTDGLKYILLFGAGSFDYKALGRGRNASNNPNYVLLYETPSSLNPNTSYTTDDFFGILDDGEGGNMNAPVAMDIAVGRLPARSLDDANVMVDKIIYYDTHAKTLADWRNQTTFIADDEDSDRHLKGAERMVQVMNLNYPDYNIDKIYSDAYQQITTSGGSRYPDVNDNILNRIFKGSFMINYLGHGGDNGWAQERIFTNSEISSLKNKDKMPLFVTATCSFGPHDNPNNISAAELLLLNPEGGAIALLTTLRLVYAHNNETLTEKTIYNIFAPINGKMPAIGEAFRRAKNEALITVPDLRKYALLGDPSMVLAYPEYNVHTTSINGQATTNKDTIKALQKVTITGEVRDDNNQLLSNFNGTIYPTIFDKADQLQTLANDGGSSVLGFSLQKKIIFKGKATVTNGKFSFSFVVPKDINYSIGYGRLSFYAEDGQSLDANGHYEGLVVGGTNQNASLDNKGPEVLVYMNDENFAPGGTTDENPILLVKLYDENGINTVGNSIGHDIEGHLTFPDQSQDKYVLNDFYESEKNDYTRGTIHYPLKNLPEGPHHIKVRAWDVYNNLGEGETDFIVTSSAELALNHVLNYPNPFTDNTKFQFEHNMPYQPLDVRIQIFTVGGQLVKTILHSIGAEDNLGYRISDIGWDGLDEFGDKIGRGVYIYKILVRGNDDTQHQASEFQKLVILK
ncbi:MAG: type IX secretion system sortase PorU [Aureispira sp.]|nr:type IX secretion system sortase PorU [Aureispira sp.]